jgi:hypothetical protein
MLIGNTNVVPWNSLFFIRLYSLLARPWNLFQFTNPMHSRYDSLHGGSAHRKAATYTEQHKHRMNARTPVGLVSPTSVLERAKTVHYIGRAASEVVP